VGPLSSSAWRAPARVERERLLKVEGVETSGPEGSKIRFQLCAETALGIATKR